MTALRPMPQTSFESYRLASAWGYAEGNVGSGRSLGLSSVGLHVFVQSVAAQALANTVTVSMNHLPSYTRSLARYAGEIAATLRRPEFMARKGILRAACSA